MIASGPTETLLGRILPSWRSGGLRLRPIHPTCSYAENTGAAGTIAASLASQDNRQGERGCWPTRVADSIAPCRCGAELMALGALFGRPAGSLCGRARRVTLGRFPLPCETTGSLAVTEPAGTGPLATLDCRARVSGDPRTAPQTFTILQAAELSLRHCVSATDEERRQH